MKSANAKRNRRTNTKPRRDIHQQVTDNIIQAIEAGAGDWQMPWHRSGEGLNRPVNIDSHKRYRGINILNLWVAAEHRGYSNGLWGTYRQWQNRGCQVRKGEKGAMVSRITLKAPPMFGLMAPPEPAIFALQTG